MGNNDLSTGLALGFLTPATADREAQPESSNQETPGKVRRRRAQEEKQGEENGLEAGDLPEHKLDDLA